MNKSAEISKDGLYRYTLTRKWEHSSTALSIVMLNPSTADADLDDPTIRRCIGFSKSHGYGGIQVVNLYAYRATNPKVLKTVTDPVGPENDAWLTRVLKYSAYWQAPVLCAWGANAASERVDRFLDLAQDIADQSGIYPGLVHLGLTKAGAPRHPLYIAGSTEFSTWRR